MPELTSAATLRSLASSCAPDAEGATVVTHEMNRPCYEAEFIGPRVPGNVYGTEEEST